MSFSPSATVSFKSNVAKVSICPSAVIPPRYSIAQPPFSRVRVGGSRLYPSACYAVPSVPCITSSKASFKSNPIVFDAVDIVEFNESDPSTQLLVHSSTTCNDNELKRRRSSIVVMESEETKRNDEILSRLDDDEDEDEELPTSRVSLSGRKYRRDDYLSIPCSSLRTFLKKENELKEVNARYHKMMEKLKAEKANHASSSPSPSMQEEEMECVSPELRDSVIPGEIDSLVEENNLRNSRLFAGSDISDTPFNPENLLSPRLSHVETPPPDMTDASDLTPLMESSSNQEYVSMELEQAPTTNSTTENMSDFDQLSNSVSQSNSIDPPNSGNSSNRRDSVPRVFTFDDASVVATQLIDTLREKLTHLPSIETVQTVAAMANQLVESEAIYQPLYEEYCRMNENDEEIDDLQADFNEVEMRLNDAALKISLITQDGFDLEEEAESVTQSIRFFAAFVKATVVFSPQSDLALYYRFGDDYVFVRVIYSNGILLRVKGNEHVEDSELKALMYTMGVAKRIRNKQYQCTKLYEFLLDFSFDMLRIYYAWSKQST